MPQPSPCLHAAGLPRRRAAANHADGLGAAIRELVRIRERNGLHCRSKARPRPARRRAPDPGSMNRPARRGLLSSSHVSND